MNRRTAISIVVLLGTSAAPPLLAADPLIAAATAVKADECLDYNGLVTHERRVSACSNAIESGRLEGPALALARLNRGAAYVAMGDSSRATTDYGEALRL